MLARRSIAVCKSAPSSTLKPGGPVNGPVSSRASHRERFLSVGCGSDCATPRTRWANEGEPPKMRLEPAFDTSKKTLADKLHIKNNETRTLTDVQVCDNVFCEEIRKVFAIFGATNEAILKEFLENLVGGIGRCNFKHTSSASQLAITIVRRGVQPSRSNLPSPLIISTMVTVPLVGSAAPLTQASR